MNVLPIQKWNLFCQLLSFYYSECNRISILKISLSLFVCLFICSFERRRVRCKDIHCSNRNKNLTERLHKCQGQKDGLDEREIMWFVDLCFSVLLIQFLDFYVTMFSKVCSFIVSMWVKCTDHLYLNTCEGVIRYPYSWRD